MSPGEWHNHMEALFPPELREIGFCTYGKGNQNCNRRTDVFLSNGRCLEIQHSFISKKDVKARAIDWEVFGKTIIWVIDGNTPDVCIEELTTGQFLISFAEPWKYESFSDVYEYLLLERDNKVFKIALSQIKGCMLVAKEWKSLVEVVAILQSKPEFVWDAWDDDNSIRSKMIIHQQGAGNGKTYGIWKSISTNYDKEHFVIVTKQHSAKHVIFNELNDQAKRGEYHIDNMVDPLMIQNNKHYVVRYTHKTSNRSCVVVIGTIDSFVYNLTSFDKAQTSDVFNSMLTQIIQNGCDKLSRNGSLRFGGEAMLLNGKAELWIDEVQDLSPNYFYAITKAMLQTGIDVHVVGDKLQSLDAPINFLTEAMSTELPNIEVVIDTPKNNNMRIKVGGMYEYINKVIHFEKYSLKEISIPTELPIEDEAPIEILHCEAERQQFVNKILEKVNEQVTRHNYAPEDFMFIFPIMKNNHLAIQLESKLNEYWITKFEDTVYAKKVVSDHWKNYEHDVYTQYAYLHKHEEGTVINLSDSEHLTRLVTIKTSKGDGRNVVFVLGCTESTFKLCSNQENDLVYESYLHVALTRAKRKLFFGLTSNGDDICNRFQKVDNHVLSKPNISKFVKIKDIMDNMNKDNFINALMLNQNEHVSKLLRCVENEQTIKKGSIPVDWKYHCIKYSLCFFYTFNAIIATLDSTKKQATSGDTYPQFMLLLNRIRKLDVVKHSVSEFYQVLSEYKSRSKSGSNADRALPHLPLMDLSHKAPYREYCEKIKHGMRTVQRNLITGIDAFTVYDMILFRYMIDLYQQKNFANITPTNIYDITHFFGHDTATKERNLLEQSSIMKSISKSCVHEIVSKSTDNIHWNVNKNIYFKGGTDDFCINHTGFNFIGDDSKTVYHISILTDLTSMNCWDIILKLLLERFIIFNSKNEDRYDNKRIDTYLMILNRGEYIKLDWNWDNSLKDTIKEHLKRALMLHYGDNHKRLFQYLQYVKRPENKPKLYGNPKCATPYKYVLEEIGTSHCPQYINDAFNELHVDWMRNKKEQVKGITNNEHIFCEMLQTRLNIACDAFFGLHDMEVDDDF